MKEITKKEIRKNDTWQLIHIWANKSLEFKDVYKGAYRFEKDKIYYQNCILVSRFGKYVFIGSWKSSGTFGNGFNCHEIRRCFPDKFKTFIVNKCPENFHLSSPSGVYNASKIFTSTIENYGHLEHFGSFIYDIENKLTTDNNKKLLYTVTEFEHLKEEIYSLPKKLKSRILNSKIDIPISERSNNKWSFDYIFKYNKSVKVKDLYNKDTLELSDLKKIKNNGFNDKEEAKYRINFLTFVNSCRQIYSEGYSIDDFKKIYDDVEKRKQYIRKLKNLKEKAREKRIEAQERRNFEALKLNLERFYNYRSNSVYYSYVLNYLRLSKDKTRIETSSGAKVLISEIDNIKKIVDYINKLKNENNSNEDIVNLLNQKIKNEKVGHFNLSRLAIKDVPNVDYYSNNTPTIINQIKYSPDIIFVIGCHNVSLSNLNYINKQLNG